MYERTRTLRDHRDRVYDGDDLVGSTAPEDGYYRGGSHRDRVPSSSSHSHSHSHREHDTSTRSSSRYEDDRTRRARSPHTGGTGDDRWIPRDKVVASNAHNGHSAASYDRPHAEGYARRSSDDQYRSGGRQDESWSSSNGRSRDGFRSAATSNTYEAWDQSSSRYPDTATGRSEGSRHRDAPQASSYTYSSSHATSHSRRDQGQWVGEEDPVGAGKPAAEPRVDERAWTRRTDDREWTKDDGGYPRDNAGASSTVKNGWEPPAVYTGKSPETKAKFVPGPGWRPELDEPSSHSRGNGRHSWKPNKHSDSKRKEKDRGNGRQSKGYDRDSRHRDSRRYSAREEGPSKGDRKAQKRRRSTSRSLSHSRSRSPSHSVTSNARAPSPSSSSKRRRKTSLSPDTRSDRHSPVKPKHRDRSSSTSRAREGDEHDRGRNNQRRSSNQRDASRSRSRRRSISPSKSPPPNLPRDESAATARGTRRGRPSSYSRSRSRSRSPSSSPQAALKTNGSSANAVKHRLPPSGPRASDLMHFQIRPVSSTFIATSSRATVAAAYSRRNLVGEVPPPGPRADTHQSQSHAAPSSNSATIPTGPKGIYPPPAAAQHQNQTHGSGSGSSSASTQDARLLPRGGKMAPLPVTAVGVPNGPRGTAPYVLPAGNALVKQFFPDDEDDLEGQDGQSAQGGGSGFGVIPKRSKHPAGRGTSPPLTTRQRTASFTGSNRATSPVATAGSNTVFVKGVYERPVRARTPRSPSPDRSYERETSRRTPTAPYTEEPSVPETPETPITTASAPAPAELYQLVNQVGEGTFGKVYKARNVVTGALVALKRIKVEAEKDGFPVTALREIKLLQSLCHPNVIYLYEMMVSKGNVYMVFNYMEHDLTGVLAQTQFSFSPAHLKSLCHQMLMGLDYLHRRGVIHRDMKGSNILVNSHGELKLADFGLARVFQKRRKNDYTNRVITLWYRPPELLLGATVYGPEVDMWSAGTIMLELFTKKPVFQGNDEIHQLEVIYRILGTATPEIWPALTDMPWYELVKPKEIYKNYFRAAFQKYLSPDALDVAEGLLAYDTEKRLTAADAMKMPYFVSEDPPMERPVGLSSVEGEWHELETKREKEKSRKRRRTEGTLPATNGHGNDPSLSSGGPG